MLLPRLVGAIPVPLTQIGQSVVVHVQRRVSWRGPFQAMVWDTVGSTSGDFFVPLLRVQRLQKSKKILTGLSGQVHSNLRIAERDRAQLADPTMSDSDDECSGDGI